MKFQPTLVLLWFEYALPLRWLEVCTGAEDGEREWSSREPAFEPRLGFSGYFVVSEFLVVSFCQYLSADGAERCLSAMSGFFDMLGVEVGCFEVLETVLLVPSDRAFFDRWESITSNTNKSWICLDYKLLTKSARYNFEDCFGCFQAYILLRKDLLRSRSVRHWSNVFCERHSIKRSSTKKHKYDSLSQFKGTNLWAAQSRAITASRHTVWTMTAEWSLRDANYCEHVWIWDTKICRLMQTFDQDLRNQWSICLLRK